jgi:hypothetical protein
VIKTFSLCSVVASLSIAVMSASQASEYGLELEGFAYPYLQASQMAARLS